jgi:hypothetical protein
MADLKLNLQDISMGSLALNEMSDHFDHVSHAIDIIRAEAGERISSSALSLDMRQERGPFQLTSLISFQIKDDYGLTATFQRKLTSFGTLEVKFAHGTSHFTLTIIRVIAPGHPQKLESEKKKDPVSKEEKL